MKPQPTEEEIQFILDSISEFLRVKVMPNVSRDQVATCLLMCGMLLQGVSLSGAWAAYGVLHLLPGKAQRLGVPAL